MEKSMIDNKNLKRWYILSLLFSFLFVYIIMAFVVVIIFKNTLAGMASFVLYYLPIIWIGMLVVTHQRFSIIQGTYNPKPKKIFTRRNLTFVYVVIGIILFLNFKEAILSHKFGSEFAAMVIFGWLIVWFGVGCLLFSDFLFEKFLKNIKSINLNLKFQTWLIVIIILLALIIALILIPLHAAIVENKKEGITYFLDGKTKNIEGIPIPFFVENFDHRVN